MYHCENEMSCKIHALAILSARRYPHRLKRQKYLEVSQRIGTCRYMRVVGAQSPQQASASHLTVLRLHLSNGTLKAVMLAKHPRREHSSRLMPHQNTWNSEVTGHATR
jgi:hypothetical protein